MRIKAVAQALLTLELPGTLSRATALLRSVAEEQAQQLATEMSGSVSGATSCVFLKYAYASLRPPDPSRSPTTPQRRVCGVRARGARAGHTKRAGHTERDRAGRARERRRRRELLGLGLNLGVFRAALLKHF